MNLTPEEIAAIDRNTLTIGSEPTPGWKWDLDADGTPMLSRVRALPHGDEIAANLNIPDETGEVTLMVVVRGEIGFIPWEVIEVFAEQLALARATVRAGTDTSCKGCLHAGTDIGMGTEICNHKDRDDLKTHGDRTPKCIRTSMKTTFAEAVCRHRALRTLLKFAKDD